MVKKSLELKNYVPKLDELYEELCRIEDEFAQRVLELSNAEVKMYVKAGWISFCLKDASDSLKEYIEKNDVFKKIRFEGDLKDAYKCLGKLSELSENTSMQTTIKEASKKVEKIAKELKII